MARTERAKPQKQQAPNVQRIPPSSRRSKPRLEVRYTRPPLYDKQRIAIFEPKDKEGNPARFAWIEASTKAGKTVGCIAWLYEQALFRGGENKNFWWVAPIGPQAKIAFRRLKKFLPKSEYEENKSELTLTLRNGAVIWFKGSDNTDSLYGEDVYAAVIDEGSRCKDGTWAAIRSTLTATRGPCRIIGNVKGRKNWFYKNAHAAKAGKANHAYYRITAADAVAAGVLAADEIEDARTSGMPEATFKELYYAEAADDAGNPFTLKAIKACLKPLSKLPPACWGWDLAKKADWTVGIALDKNGDVCRFERWQLDWETTTNRIITMIGVLPAYIDATGVGDPIVERVQKRCVSAEGYIFSQASKQRLMEGLAVALGRGETSVLDSGDPANASVHQEELESFEYEYTKTGVRYCLSPETRILRKDLHWAPIESLRVGDWLVGFDEEPLPGNKTRRWASSQVLRTRRIMQPCYEIKFDDGSEVIASEDHKWLISAAGPLCWKETKELRGLHAWSKSKRFAPHRVIRLLDVWDAPHSYGQGYLAAAFDGEGSLSQRPCSEKHNNGHEANLSMAQKDNAMLAMVEAELTKQGFQWGRYGNGGGSNGDVFSIGLKGRRDDLLRFLGGVRPKRLLAKFDLDKLGTLERKAYATVQSVKFLGQRPVIAMQTSTRTFVAEGLASHNCAPEGYHDDCVMAHGLAVMAKSRATVDLDVWHALVKK